MNGMFCMLIRSPLLLHAFIREDIEDSGALLLLLLLVSPSALAIDLGIISHPLLLPLSIVVVDLYNALPLVLNIFSFVVPLALAAEDDIVCSHTCICFDDDDDGGVSSSS